jgi:hypothetical protein
MQHIQLQLVNGRLGQGHVRTVRRVKRPAKHTNALRAACRCSQTQSRRTKNCVVSAASGEPASG